MEIPVEKDVIATRRLRTDLLINLSALVVLTLFHPLMLAWQIYRAPEELQLPPPESVFFPILKNLAIGLIVSSVIGKWATSRLVAKVKNQHLSQGAVLDNQNSIFANFGFNLAMGALIGLSISEGYICDLPLTEDVSGSLTTLLNCNALVNSVTALFVGIVMGLGIWMIYQIANIEKETNKKIMVQYYSTRQWSLIFVAVVAAVVYVVGLAFFKIVTLG